MATRSFAYKDKYTSKWWTISNERVVTKNREHFEIITTWGSTGSLGTRKVLLSTISSYEATRLFDKKIREKLNKGYQEISGSTIIVGKQAEVKPKETITEFDIF